MNEKKKKNTRKVITSIVLGMSALIIVAMIILLTKVPAEMVQYVFMGGGLLILNLLFVLYFTRHNSRR